MLPSTEGFVYPNEASAHPLWSVLIVVYPYITGLVAGAFIMASLVRVFNVKKLEPVYRLSLLTALAFLLCAPLPLLFHLGHPERCFEVMMTPHLSSPMAMFGFVYAWYLMAVLLLELWFDYRHDFVKWADADSGLRGVLYRCFTLGVHDVDDQALRLDARMARVISIVGIPSAFLLHGYVGFIFGSIKANPWWGNVLMPIIFIFSAIVSGMALCVFIYMMLSWARRTRIDMDCLDLMLKFLFFALVVDAAIESLDWVHRLYSAEEEIQVLKSLAAGKLFYTLLVGQACMGTAVPLLLLGGIMIFRKRLSEPVRQRTYLTTSVLILVGVLAMRWNVVIGGQLFSKSLRGFMDYKLEFAGHEGWLLSALLLALPFIILSVFFRLFLPVQPPGTSEPPPAMTAAPKPA
ncbi:MAG: polysulfide reductase NrfD [Verrucomicrobia bacterium]|nr:polysulfide reductase NrfD [Verrucomicrobiota bacterium]